MRKLCVIYNFAAHYRLGIFRLIDQSYHCDWFFGKKNDDVSKMDLSQLNGNVVEVDHFNWSGFEYQKGILKLIRKDYTDYLVFAQTKTISTWFFLFLSKFYPRKKVYLWSHGFYGKETKWETTIKRLMFLLPNGGTFLYNAYARKLMIDQGINPDKLFVIHNSLDYDNQLKVRKTLKRTNIYFEYFNNHNHTVIFIGRLTKIKKLDSLLELVLIMKRKGTPINMVFVGDGVEHQHLVELANDYNIKENIWFYGACYEESKNAELIYNADVCVAPGNVGLTAIHSMIYGTPVITHNDFAHQMPEFEAIKEGSTGAFFECGNVESMQKVLTEWLNKHDGDREEVREACYSEIDKNWTPEFQIAVLRKEIEN